MRKHTTTTPILLRLLGYLIAAPLIVLAALIAPIVAVRYQ
ncbi:hypothetical protein DFR75_11287 [Nocardia ignorata]|uniref:Uncharacterized protein n=1 Tax=Nocardia ignorata TaxID=145285 RepID=A0A4R6NYW9_NOCIG|nr:hypothetical protein DFR75_11287 [Nocardia ignorata]